MRGWQQEKGHCWRTRHAEATKIAATAEGGFTSFLETLTPENHVAPIERMIEPSNANVNVYRGPTNRKQTPLTHHKTTSDHRPERRISFWTDAQARCYVTGR